MRSATGHLFTRRGAFQIGQPVEAVHHALHRRGQPPGAHEIGLRDGQFQPVHQKMPGAQRGAGHLVARQRVGDGGQQLGPRRLAEGRGEHRPGHAQPIGQPDQPRACPHRGRREIGQRQRAARLHHGFGLTRGGGFVGAWRVHNHALFSAFFGGGQRNGRGSLLVLRPFGHP
jgi:hypothetical protein